MVFLCWFSYLIMKYLNFGDSFWFRGIEDSDYQVIYIIFREGIAFCIKLHSLLSKHHSLDTDRLRNSYLTLTVWVHNL